MNDWSSFTSGGKFADRGKRSRLQSARVCVCVAAGPGSIPRQLSLHLSAPVALSQLLLVSAPGCRCCLLPVLHLARVILSSFRHVPLRSHKRTHHVHIYTTTKYLYAPSPPLHYVVCSIFQQTTSK